MAKRLARWLALAAAAATALPADALRLELELVVARLASSAACSAFQEQTTKELYAVAASTDACQQYTVTSAALTYISAPCSASACVQVAEELAAQLPDCEIDGSNEKAQLQDALAACGFASSAASSSPTAASPTQIATRSPDAAVSSSSSGSVGDECSTSQLANITDLYMEATDTAACSDYMSSTVFDIYAPCSASDCIAVIRDMAAAMPNCSYGGDNLKQELYDGFGSCETTSNNNGTSSYTDIPVVTKPASSSSGSGECSGAEVSELTSLYTRAASTDACAEYTTITASYVDIEPPCNATACLSELLDVASQMPNCSYEGVNYKTGLAQGVAECGVSANGSSAGSTDVSGQTSATSGSSDNAAVGATATVWALGVHIGAVFMLALVL